MTKDCKRFPILRKELPINKDEERKKKTFEKQIFFLMVAVYCQNCHTAKKIKFTVLNLDFPENIQTWISEEKRVSKYRLCPDCYELIENAFRHTENCPHSSYKTFCHECPTPCYREEEQAKMLPIMHYSGKRIIRAHPIYALRFFGNLIRNKIRIKKHMRKMEARKNEQNQF